MCLSRCSYISFSGCLRLNTTVLFAGGSASGRRSGSAAVGLGKHSSPQRTSPAPHHLHLTSTPPHLRGWGGYGMVSRYNPWPWFVDAKLPGYILYPMPYQTCISLDLYTPYRTPCHTRVSMSCHTRKTYHTHTSAEQGIPYHISPPSEHQIHVGEYGGSETSPRRYGQHGGRKQGVGLFRLSPGLFRLSPLRLVTIGFDEAISNL